MKNKVLIIEDNYYKIFTTKQLLETQLKLDVSVVEVDSGKELAKKTMDYEPSTVMYKPAGGVADLLSTMKKRGSNRRNTDIFVLYMTHEMDEAMERQVQEYFSGYSKGVAKAA